MTKRLVAIMALVCLINGNNAYAADLNTLNPEGLTQEEIAAINVDLINVPQEVFDNYNGSITFRKGEWIEWNGITCAGLIRNCGNDYKTEVTLCGPHTAFVIMHELGHYYTGMGTEEEADAFAYASMGGEDLLKLVSGPGGERYVCTINGCSVERKLQ